MNSPKKQELALAIRASVQAGAAILRYYGSEVAVESKADSSPLTAADLAAHEVILETLQGGSSLPVLSEESKEVPFSERSAWERFWLVDPLDGTKEFINQNGEFTVNIALVEAGRPVLGVVYVPALSRLYFGGEDIGAFLQEVAPENVGSIETELDNRILLSTKLSGAPANDSNYTIIGSRSHGSPEYESFVSELRTRHPNAQTISAGSSLKFCRVVEGAANIYPRLGRTMEWDTAAGHALVNAVGKKVCVFESDEELSYNKDDLGNPWFVVQ